MGLLEGRKLPSGWAGVKHLEAVGAACQLRDACVRVSWSQNELNWYKITHQPQGISTQRGVLQSITRLPTPRHIPLRY